MISRNHWLIQHPLLPIVGCGIFWRSVRETCPFALPFVSPPDLPFSVQTHHVGLTAAPAQRRSHPLCEAARASRGATFHVCHFLHLFLALHCLPHWGLVRWGGASRVTVGLRNAGCCGVWHCLEGVPCPCWQLPSSPHVENQLFFAKVNLLPVNTGNVVHMCSVCV